MSLSPLIGGQVKPIYMCRCSIYPLAIDTLTSDRCVCSEMQSLSGFSTDSGSMAFWRLSFTHQHQRTERELSDWCAKCLLGNKRNSLLILTDNREAIFYLNKQGGTCSSAVSQEAILLWDLWITNSIDLEVSCLPETQNNLADHLSRLFTSHHKWSLHPDVARYIFHHWGFPSVDLYATSTNRKFSSSAPYKVTAQVPWQMCFCCCDQADSSTLFLQWEQNRVIRAGKRSIYIPWTSEEIWSSAWTGPGTSVVIAVEDRIKGKSVSTQRMSSWIASFIHICSDLSNVTLLRSHRSFNEISELRWCLWHRFWL